MRARGCRSGLILVLIVAASSASHALADGDCSAVTCNDPADLPVGTVVATGTVLVG